MKATEKILVKELKDIYNENIDQIKVLISTKRGLIAKGLNKTEKEKEDIVEIEDWIWAITHEMAVEILQYVANNIIEEKEVQFNL